MKIHPAWLIVLALASTYSGCASTRPILPKSQSDVVKIVAAYKNFEFEMVILLAEQMLDSHNASPGERVDSLLWAGAASYLLGDTARACESFRMALTHNPKVELNQDLFPDAIVALFKQTKQSRRQFAHSRRLCRMPN